MRKRVSGIYGIKNIKTGKMYIGRSINIYDRFRHHRNNLRGNKHHSRYLQNSFNKYGEGAFIYGIIEECSNEETYKKEKYYISKYDSFNNGYNECVPTGNKEGRVFTDEDKVKHSIAIKKHRAKASKEFWRKNAAGLAKGRVAAYTTIIRKIYLYDKDYNLIHTADSHADCAKYLNVRFETFERALRKRFSKGHWTYKDFIIVKEGETIEEYIQKHNEYIKKRDYKRIERNKIIHDESIKNKIKRDKEHAEYLVNNKETRLKSWAENSKKATQALRASGKYAIEVFLKDTGEFVGKWDLPKDFADEYGLKRKAISKVLSGEQKSHRGYVISRVSQ